MFVIFPKPTVPISLLENPPDSIEWAKWSDLLVRTLTYPSFLHSVPTLCSLDHLSEYCPRQQLVRWWWLHLLETDEEGDNTVNESHVYSSLTHYPSRVDVVPSITFLDGKADGIMLRSVDLNNSGFWSVSSSVSSGTFLQTYDNPSSLT